eukprot:TRINITY_DN17996_c0_g1_i1.p3 TRINITY_DN17996_c0_g1~~TRINITY_DN17996_c0_g1_i1.p3  ORF type:complete len:130 (-),score=0.04 TRINITY_DN17996_c0_g1_i1:296-655(-)
MVYSVVSLELIQLQQNSHQYEQLQGPKSRNRLHRKKSQVYSPVFSQNQRNLEYVLSNRLVAYFQPNFSYYAMKKIAYKEILVKKKIVEIYAFLYVKYFSLASVFFFSGMNQMLQENNIL